MMIFLIPFLFSNAHASSYGLFEPTANWNKKEVRVCWFDGGKQLESRDDVYTAKVTFLTSAEKIHYQQLVEKNYTPELTGVSFVGWQNCSAKNEDLLSDAVIVANTEGLAQGVLGQSDVGVARQDSSNTPEGFFDKNFFSRLDADTLTTTKRVVQLSLERNENVKIPLKEAMRKKQPALLEQEMQALKDSTFLHELGHLAGLRHEQARNDRKVDEDAAWPVNSDKDDQQYEKSATYNTPYDHLSMMNYNQTGVLLSLYAAMYLCKEGFWAPRVGAKFDATECAGVEAELPKFVALTKYDQVTLQTAYLGRSNVTDFDLNTRAFIDQITKKIKTSKLAPAPVMQDQDQPGSQP